MLVNRYWNLCLLTMSIQSVWFHLRVFSSLPDIYNKTSNVKHVSFMLHQKLYSFSRRYICTFWLYFAFSFIFFLILNKIWLIHVHTMHMFLLEFWLQSYQWMSKSIGHTIHTAENIYEHFNRFVDKHFEHGKFTDFVVGWSTNSAF